MFSRKNMADLNKEIKLCQVCGKALYLYTISPFGDSVYPVLRSYRSTGALLSIQSPPHSRCIVDKKSSGSCGYIEDSWCPPCLFGLASYTFCVDEIPYKRYDVARSIILAKQFAVDAFKHSFVDLAKHVRLNGAQIGISQFVDYLDIGFLCRLVPRVVVALVKEGTIVCTSSIEREIDNISYYIFKAFHLPVKATVVKHGLLQAQIFPDANKHQPRGGIIGHVRAVLNERLSSGS